jgi:ribosomal protein L31
MVDFHDRRDSVIKNINNPDQFGSTKGQVEETALQMGLHGVRDPFTGTVHVDLSNPEHPFWKKLGE